ncbi:IS3 family transposase [Pandoraea thiooxydans]|uniref:IS3 family transposase n=1 Tax=Pandoraea thiooxydans TaxID=445709 RepID=UPI001F029CB1|nr:IS3 family transposase [Pandoraea thiooxydans]
MTRNTQAIEVVTVSQERRRRWSAQEKASLVKETYEPGMSVSLVARRHGISASQLFNWRKLEREGALVAVHAGESVVPASELAAARAQIAQLQRMLGKKTMEAEILREAVEIARGKKVDCALTLIGQGRPVKPVCVVLGVARSHVVDLLKRPADWVDARVLAKADPIGDAMIADAVRAEITALPTYGYRRAGALVNRTRSLIGLRPVNHKRMYRVMKEQGLLLPKSPKRRDSGRPHAGKVAVEESNRRWCSDGFEIACENGEVVTGVFMKDCCDREIISWRAWTGRGLPGEPVRDMMIEAVEARFGTADERVVMVEFLSDNGGAFRANETHALARALGIKPVHTPVNSPQSNGMAESFVNTFKRDYVGSMDRSSGAAVLAQLPGAFRHFNEVHPHSALGYKSPRMFRKERRRQALENGAN